MSTCYEFALTCNLKDDISQDVIDVLSLMTRSTEEDFTFTTTLKHPLFTSGEDRNFEDGFDCPAEWKVIIANDPDEGEELLPGIFGSSFRDRKFSVRIFINDDAFHNTFDLLVDWLASVCESDGFVGYYLELRNLWRNNDPVLIYFENGQVFEKHVAGELRQLLS